MEGGEGRMGGNERMERGREGESNEGREGEGWREGGREGEMTSKHWSTAVCPLLLCCCMHGQYLVHSDGLAIKLDHVHDLDGIVRIFFPHELHKAVALVGLGDPVTRDVYIHCRARRGGGMR